ncbi:MULTISPECIES: Hpt domain-containing protein [unclassified Oleiphilus]|jgi:HPt (histidine-containing phosphotransfer) domain-containing protein|uniref:Hpt domain-containing protein n=3 Tax=Oleiphilus TaxID=141450 RepID=UPI0007C3044B|nr:MULTISPECIES: Hpt domain-containing protein [unclassified Oleiphilus]KZY75805.1 hypothetical protein A3740_14455 [Oleiphilus sp. HI0068]KZY77327.1 hypothetical protein A3741_09790 [Oleiphilus sp. HI0069]KZY88040.1 hypothetical protein A3743_01550 [Oleiphilus sp. HI0072]KZZ07946.1 hypothetical protein A3749_00235 [Oleiphilus sp. HI0078]KZZ19177.1 hypothetical protein A3752_15430 [Oleiphilus sp. HI0081]KZZ32919.1 hypothetical protein A3755_08865 [Oleiphilus sp. HI0085]
MSDQTSESQCIDMDKLTETFMNNMDIVKQVLSSFKGSFVTFEEEFLNAQQQGDTELMSRLAHGLKGSAGNIRASSLSAKAADLQHKIDLGEAPGLLAEEVISGLAALICEIDAVTTG